MLRVQDNETFGVVTVSPKDLSPYSWLTVMFLILYIVQGSINLLLNGIIAVAIISSAATMKKYLIVLAKVPLDCCKYRTRIEFPIIF